MKKEYSKPEFVIMSVKSSRCLCGSNVEKMDYEKGDWDEETI